MVTSHITDRISGTWATSLMLHNRRRRNFRFWNGCDTIQDGGGKRKLRLRLLWSIKLVAYTTSYVFLKIICIIHKQIRGYRVLILNSYHLLITLHYLDERVQHIDMHWCHIINWWVELLSLCVHARENQSSQFKPIVSTRWWWWQ